MQIYNSLTRKKEEFVPRENGKVHLYVCGITAYDLCHIGHARAAVVFDVLVRFLRYLDYKVIFVRNFTDIDDKIITRAKQEGIPPAEVAEKNIQHFYRDMEQLNILKADFEPRATEHIQEMIDLISILIDKGHAYPTPSGDVYFKVRSFPEYGKLSGRNIEELQVGVRIDSREEKEDPLDFALWKHSKQGEPAWPSPWGEGRPGWHIECSVMSEKYLGLPLDIHGGGQDLIFPHHENERAQTVAATGQEFVRYWMHNGFVQVQSEKMSKSLNNFITIQDILKKYHPEVLRFFLLNKHYRSPLDFTWEGLQEAEKALKRIYQTKHLLAQALDRQKWSQAELPAEIQIELTSFLENFLKHLEDDLNTAAAIGQIFNLVRLANRILEDKVLARSVQSRELFKEILHHLESFGQILGLFSLESEVFINQLRESKALRKGIDMAQVEEMLEQRQQARTSKNFSQADQIRNKLEDMGVEVQDTPKGPVWDIN